MKRRTCLHFSLEVNVTQCPADGNGPGPVECAQPTRPLRRDAERNRQRILKAALEVFTERGLDASLDEVARHAGVGVGTVYRRFRTKEELVEALFVNRIEEVAALAEEATRAADPWSGLACFMEQAATILAEDTAFIVFVLTDAAQFARRVNPDIWRRYLTLILDGLRPGREGVSPLPVPALRPDEFEMTMRQNAPRHH